MFLFRLFLVLCVVWLLIRIFKWIKRSPVLNERGEKRVPVVRCGFCEMYLDKNDAYKDGDMFFCDETHCRAYRQRAGQ